MSFVRRFQTHSFDIVQTLYAIMRLVYLVYQAGLCTTMILGKRTNSGHRQNNTSTGKNKDNEVCRVSVTTNSSVTH
jgi:hypothetical protein